MFLLKAYRSSWRNAYLKSFNDYVINVFSKEHNYIKLRKSKCERFYISFDDWFVIRIDDRTDTYLNMEENISSKMRYFENNGYHIITLNVYDNYKDPQVVIKDHISEYLENLRILRK